MLLSFALLFVVGMVLGEMAQKLRVPRLVGYLLTGILLGSSVLNVIDESVMDLAVDIRHIALIIVLIRAGLELDLSKLRRHKGAALGMCFLPATFEILAVVFLGSYFLGLSYLEGALLGAVLGAVSPAVIVPRMIQLTREGYGNKRGIPQLILAGSSVDDIYVIVLFMSFLDILRGGTFSYARLLNIPFSILTGSVIGLALAWLLNYIWHKMGLTHIYVAFSLLMVSLLLLAGEESITGAYKYSALLATICMGVGLKKINPLLTHKLTFSYRNLWLVAEVFLFALVGVHLDLSYLQAAGLLSVLVILAALVFRSFGVLFSLIGGGFTWKEKLFLVLSSTPKATVQAAIGGIPLGVGLACGTTVLTVAIVSILLTAPLGAWLIDFSSSKLLEKDLIDADLDAEA